MHKKMLALSALCRERGNPAAPRRAIGRAQCNDAYWHGVFGGLYLPHLRAAIWQNLALAECELRRGEELAVERLDLDGELLTAPQLALGRSEEHTSELQSRPHLVCRLLLAKKKISTSCLV